MIALSKLINNLGLLSRKRDEMRSVEDFDAYDQPEHIFHKFGSADRYYSHMANVDIYVACGRVRRG